MPEPRRLALAALAAALALAPAIGVAQGRGGRGGQAAGARDHGQPLPAAGLSVAFHGGAACEPVSSPYGSATRYDGSLRHSGGGEEGTHGGIDLSLPEGTPLRAMAAGRVFAHGEGGRLEGFFVWLLHLPEESGLAFPFLAKYQHLREASPLPPGHRVRAGEVVATSGRSGTQGGHYGAMGYAHLHLTLRALTAEGARLAAAGDDGFRMLRDTVLVDPLAAFVPGLADPAHASSLPGERRRLVVAHVDAAGVARPADARVVWPVACP